MYQNIYMVAFLVAKLLQTFHVVECLLTLISCPMAFKRRKRNIKTPFAVVTGYFRAKGVHLNHDVSWSGANLTLNGPLLF